MAGMTLDQLRVFVAVAENLTLPVLPKRFTLLNPL
jgi:hypothetical protein